MKLQAKTRLRGIEIDAAYTGTKVKDLALWIKEVTEGKVKFYSGPGPNRKAGEMSGHAPADSVRQLVVQMVAEGWRGSRSVKPSTFDPTKDSDTITYHHADTNAVIKVSKPVNGSCLITISQLTHMALRERREMKRLNRPFTYKSNERDERDGMRAWGTYLDKVQEIRKANGLKPLSPAQVYAYRDKFVKLSPVTRKIVMTRVGL